MITTIYRCTRDSNVFHPSPSLPFPPFPLSDKVSHLVSAQGSKIYGYLATPDMLAAAAVAHWREGVVVGAARHLDSMEAKVKSVAKVGSNRIESVWFGSDCDEVNILRGAYLAHALLLLMGAAA